MKKLTQTDIEIRTYSNNTELINERRQQILQGAIDIFLRKGFNATTLRDISQATGFSIGNIYRYIGSKDDLLHLLCQVRSHAREGLEKIAAEHKNQDIIVLLKDCIRYHFTVGDASRNFNLFFNREIYHFSPADRHILLESQIQVVDFFKEILDHGVAQGVFQIRSTQAMAHNILMLGHDWGLRYWYLSKHFSLEQYTDIQTEFILKQILTPSSAADISRKSQ